MTDIDRILDNIPPAVWNAHVWPKGQSYVHGSIDGADRKRIVHRVLEAAQASQDRPSRDDTPSGGGTDGQATPKPAERRTRDQAHHAAHHAQTQGGQAGIASGLAAIALALLAGQEPR